MSVTVVLASSNQGKLEELARLLPPEIDIRLASEFGVTFLPENGSTFAENAIEKARTAASSTGFMAIGDDSGLEVDALNGAPGIRSARYAGESATDEQNISKLLASLQGFPDSKRTARFRCVVALVTPDGRIQTAERSISGNIGASPRGDRGFGYDPVFVTSTGRTFAELTADEKDALSHRGRALRALAPKLIRMLQQSTEEIVTR